MCRRGPERALGRSRRRRRAGAWCGPWPGVPAGGASPRRRLGTRPARRSSREAPPGSRGLHPPLSLPPLGGPLKGTGGAQRAETRGGGCVLSEKSSAAPEWRPRVINKLRFCPGAATEAGRRIGRACGEG